MKNYKIKFVTEIQGTRTVTARILADNPVHAKQLFVEKAFERYLVVDQKLVETPVDGTFEIVEDTGAFDVV